MRGSTLFDDTLVAGMGAGDQRAGVTFVRRYQACVYRLALRMLGDPVLALGTAKTRTRRGLLKLRALALTHDLAS